MSAARPTRRAAGRARARFTDPDPEGVPHPVAPVRQARSSASQRALLDAFARLLETRPYESITVSEVCQGAGLSVGGFYARFSGKDALLLPLVERMARDATRALDRAMSRAEGDDSDLEDVVRAYTTSMVRWMGRHRPLLTSVSRAASGAAAEAIGAQLAAFNRHAHARFREAAAARSARISHPDAALAIDFSLFMISAAARDATSRGMWGTFAIRPTESTIIEELVRAWMAYLSAAR